MLCFCEDNDPDLNLRQLLAAEVCASLFANQGGGGGFHVQYAGPDTAANGKGANGVIPNAQFIDPSNLFWSTAAPAAGNNYLGAGQINNAVIVPAFATSTIDAQGSDLNATFSGLTLGDGSILVTNNQLGNGTIGFTSAVNMGLAALVAPNSGALSLIGGVADNGNGLIKTGSGTLYLGGSSAFTGNLSLGQGALVLNAASALPTGFTFVNGLSALTNALAITGTAGSKPGTSSASP